MSNFSSTGSIDNRTYQTIVISLIGAGLILIAVVSYLYRRRRRLAFAAEVRRSLNRSRGNLSARPDGTLEFEYGDPSRGGTGGGRRCGRGGEGGKEPWFWEVEVGGKGARDREREGVGEKEEGLIKHGGAGMGSAIESKEGLEEEDTKIDNEKAGGLGELDTMEKVTRPNTGGWEPIRLSYLTHASDSVSMNPPPGTRPPQPTSVELTILIAMPSQQVSASPSSSSSSSHSDAGSLSAGRNRDSTISASRTSSTSSSSSSLTDLKNPQREGGGSEAANHNPQFGIEKLPHYRQSSQPRSLPGPSPTNAWQTDEYEPEIPIMEMGTTTLRLSKANKGDDEALKRIKKSAILAGLTTDDSAGGGGKGGRGRVCRGGVRVERTDGFRGTGVGF